MSLIPKIEKVARDATISHFSLMFGYKLFSLYFPLFLVARGMSLPEVGYTYLLIYLPIALISPLVGFLNHKINPATLASIGILGYSAYALGMILIRTPALFYLWQVLLGISAAMFFVSVRAILISSRLENYDRAFGWFYTAPFYVDAIAPVVGAAFIWKFNFTGVFIFSLIIQFFTAIFCLSRLKKSYQKTPHQKLRSGLGLVSNQVRLWCGIFHKIKEKNILFPILISFSILLIGGFYQAFFVLFLKDLLHWSQNLILIYNSISSLLFLPVSFFVIGLVARQKSERNIFQGSFIYGIFSALVGFLLSILNFWTILLIMIGQGFGGLMVGAGRSGLLSQKLKENPEEAGALDTVFSPLGVALGALISGTIIGFLGYQPLFILGGIFIITVSLIAKKFAKF